MLHFQSLFKGLDVSMIVCHSYAQRFSQAQVSGSHTEFSHFAEMESHTNNQPSPVLEN